MKQITLYRLAFPHGFHLDAGSYGYETSEVMIHSDTLFGALCCCANMLGGNGWVEKLKEGLILSSAFPFLGKRLFFPKPLHLSIIDFPDHYEREKAWKKVRYLEEKLLRRALKGNLNIPNEFLPEKVKNRCWFDGSPEEVLKTVEHPRVSIDRITQATTIFHFQEVHFEPEGGLFFLADCQSDKSVEGIFKASLQLLGDEGIGSDGTVGKGWFIPSKGEPFESLPTLSDNRHYLLSLYHPTSTEVPLIDARASNYDLLVRRGWSSFLGNMDYRRKSVKMFVEGSVLAIPQIPQGHNPSVAPDMPEVVRYGKALTVKSN